MPLDPQAQNLIDMMVASGAPPFWTCDPVAARAQMAQIAHLLRPGPSLGRVEDIDLGGGDRILPARLYVPANPDSLIVYFHGGGWVFGDVAEFDTMCRELAVRASAAVLFVVYRLAPEHPFPAAVDDAFAAMAGLDHGMLGLKEGLPLFVMGDSAGGNLAAVVAQRCTSLALAGQVLVYPVVQPVLDTPTYIEFEKNGPMLGRAAMEWFWQLYTPNPAQRTDPRASPLLAAIDRTPIPALVLTAEYDPLRWEGEAYADALAAAGGGVERARFEGMPHGFFTMVGLIDRAETAIERAAQWIRARVRDHPIQRLS